LADPARRHFKAAWPPKTNIWPPRTSAAPAQSLLTTVCTLGTPVSADRGRVSHNLTGCAVPLQATHLQWVFGTAAMPTLLQKTLKVVPAPLVQVGVPSAPPALEWPNPTVEFKCGNCGAVLMRGEEGKVYPLVILCSSCGSYNNGVQKVRETNMMTDDWKPSHREVFQHQRKPKQQQQQQQQPVESTTDIEDLKRRVERLEEIIRTMLHGNLP
jgi:uncharacterized Zn finger protein (UPF0148 family)